MNQEFFARFCFLAVCIFSSICCIAQFREVKSQSPPAHVVPVTKPGVYASPGMTYMLVNDITDPTSALFLGKDVTLDLNGHTVRFADADYQHIPNSGFEDGAKGWDLSRAPGARVVNTEDVHVFIGEKIMSLKKGDQISSPYINLPVANRSYFAMCGVTGFDYHDMGGDLKNQMSVSIYVDDERGKEVRITTTYSDTTLVSVPVEKRSPRLGGGFVYAHLHGLPAGKYRIRVKAETDCLIDEVDIRPAMDVGIGMVGRTHANGHYDHLYNGVLAAFFDQTKDVSRGTPHDSIPVLEGVGTVTIKNGTIINATKGIVSWGIQSTADDVRLILDNVKIVTSGINSIAVDVPHATITNCRFEVDNPFLVNRHGASFYAVDLRGPRSSEVSYSEFFGGQGCLVFKGKQSNVHHNYFVNKQMVTNHYSVMAMGDSSRVFENRVEPEIGSGIEIYRQRYIDIFNNVIRIKTSPPTCEYGHEEYSTAAIRMADYLAPPGSPRGCYGNRVYNNRIFVSAVPQKGVDTYVPMAWAIYYSASGGDNYVFGNEIVIDKPDLSSKPITTSFYISGGPEGFGGRFYSNRITTNVPAAWIATLYGGAANSKIFNNTIIRSANSGPDFKAIRMGSFEADDRVARNIEFRSNTIVNAPFEVEATNQEHSYSVYWTLTVIVSDRSGKVLGNVPVEITDRDGVAVFSGVTDARGMLSCELPQFKVAGSGKTVSSPYQVKAANVRKTIDLRENTTANLVVRK